MGEKSVCYSLVIDKNSPCYTLGFVIYNANPKNITNNVLVTICTLHGLGKVIEFNFL